MMCDATTGIPVILFGAFDRHNFGDLLFPHITAALLGDALWFAGLAHRDFRHDGGHRVHAIRQLAADWRERPVNLVHVGGELLTCDAWEAAVMLLSPDEAQATIAHFDSRPQDRLAWAHSRLGIPALAPYTLARELFPCAAAVIYNAVGGVDLDACAPALRTEVLTKLRAAQEVSVRDTQTQAILATEGITARLTPDPAVMVAELFGPKIGRHSQRGEVAQVLAAFPQGYIAVQFSADFGDDETLDEIAAQLDRIAMASGYGVVFFRAGAAPWHDDTDCYRRTAARMNSPSPKIFTSLNLWDICALIACCRVYCGSSLHGRIVAMAFALPRVNLVHPGQRPGKQAAFAATWDDADMPATVEAKEIAQGIHRALTTNPEQRQRTARELAAHYRKGFEAISAALDS